MKVKNKLCRCRHKSILKVTYKQVKAPDSEERIKRAYNLIFEKALAELQKKKADKP